jgi:hypothetical protein
MQVVEKTNQCVQEAFNSGLWEPEDPEHGIEGTNNGKFQNINCKPTTIFADFRLYFPTENDLDRQNPNEDGADVYEDDEARVFHDKGGLVSKYILLHIY